MVVFPAYVGMSPIYALAHHANYRVPRIRGDEPEALKSAQSALACSPHTWG